MEKSIFLANYHKLCNQKVCFIVFTSFFLTQNYSSIFYHVIYLIYIYFP